MTYRKEYVPQEKAGSVTWRMAHGKSFTVRQVADEFGMTWQGANRLLCTLERVLPIAPNSTGVWRRLDVE
jgi:hypothetical protein